MRTRSHALTSTADDNPPNNQKQSTELLELVESKIIPFHTPRREPFVRFLVGDHLETYRVDSSEFYRWLTHEYYQSFRDTPHDGATKQALHVISARAQIDGYEEPVFTRVRELDGAIYLNLGDCDWRAVRISRDGWRIVDSSDVAFTRGPGMLSRPVPSKGGALDELRKFANLSTHTDWILFLAWLTAAVRPRGPYPILALHGGQGSAKSTLTRIAAKLVDPSSVGLRTLPSHERDLMVAAKCSHVLPFDNVSAIRPWLSDALCRLATGGGLGVRKNYTDDVEYIFEAQRPIILNGIEDLGVRDDLLDRMLILHLPEIPGSKRVEEKRFWAEFDGAHPRIVGALLDVVCAAMRELDSVKLPELPRMADFAAWCTAAEKALGLKRGDFLDAYNSNRAEATAMAIESSPVACELIRFMENRAGWMGTNRDLLEALNRQVCPETRRQWGWPKSPRALASAIARSEKNLRTQSAIRYTRTRREPGTGSRIFRLEKIRRR
jgi:hypothetical protein